MEAMKQSWTDDRLDDLNGKVDVFRLETRTEFRAVRAEAKDEFAAVREEMREGFDKVDRRFDKIDARFEKMDERFQAMELGLREIYRTMLWFCGAAMTALLGVIATLLGTVLL
jgi:uncharacterized coiled-coil DUF342 family protein